MILGTYFMDFLSELRDINIPESIIQKIARHFGGNPVYIPKPKKVDFNDRNAQIYRDFNGKNTLHLSQKYDLCYQQICKIIRNERKKRQGDLFAS